jgi:alkylation response protein AidB-like acyl-CoA dehydrogenase
MILHPTADQRSLIDDAFSRPLDEMLPLERLHRADAAEPWQQLAELGIFGIAAPAEAGGVGLTAVEEALLGIELGRRLAGPQVIATLAAGGITDGDVQAGIVSGATRVAAATLEGGTVHLFDAEGAAFVLLRRRGDAVLVPADALSGRTPVEDDHWTVRIEAATLSQEPGDWLRGVSLLRVRLLEAAALCGIAARASEIAVEYAGFRQQFGRPIGAFQAVKHHCANMAMAARAATDQVTFAAVALDQGRPDGAYQVEAALLLAIDAALGNSRLDIQVHGGIGFSAEADPHLFLKRAHVLSELAGGSDAAIERVAAADSPMRR